MLVYLGPVLTKETWFTSRRRKNIPLIFVIFDTLPPVVVAIGTNIIYARPMSSFVCAILQSKPWRRSEVVVSLADGEDGEEEIIQS